MPFWISVWILSHWMRDTTGPMVVPSARGSPALVLSATLLAMAATSFIFDSGTIIREGALHDWPELLNMCITPPATALLRSAPSRMTFGDLPPSSWLTRFTVGAASAGATLHVIWFSGQFHGVIMPTTPTGSRTTIAELSGASK